MRGDKLNMLLHFCRCGRPIPQGVAMCDSCRAKAKSRHMIYNQQARSKRAAAFYVSRAWRIMRARILDLFDGWDIVAFYEDGELIKAEEVHHIEELEEDWDRRLDPMNLVPLAHATHTRVTAEYKRGPEAAEACKARLRGYVKKWFAEAGGIEKVLAAAGLVAPLSVTEKSPHEEKSP